MKYILFIIAISIISLSVVSSSPSILNCNIPNTNPLCKDIAGNITYANNVSQFYTSYWINQTNNITTYIENNNTFYTENNITNNITITYNTTNNITNIVDADMNLTQFNTNGSTWSIDVLWIYNLVISKLDFINGWFKQAIDGTIGFNETKLNESILSFIPLVVNGTDGQNGSNGIDGQNGSAGANGLNGTNGINGTFTDILNATEFINNSNVWSIDLSWLYDWAVNLFYTKDEIDGFASSIVPYSGATDNVNIGGYNVTASNFFGNLDYSWLQSVPNFALSTAKLDVPEGTSSSYGIVYLSDYINHPTEVSTFGIGTAGQTLFVNPSANGYQWNSTSILLNSHTHSLNNLTAGNMNININMTSNNITQVNYIKLNPLASACDLTINHSICTNSSGMWIIG